MIGIWTDKFGFHNSWEFWVYSVVYGLVIGPNFSISQTMMGELSPPGFEYMVRAAHSPSSVAICSQFFGLFGLSNRSAAIIGLNVIQVIVDKKGNNWKAFPVLFVLSALGCLVVWLGVDVPKGRDAAAQWAVEQRGTGASAYAMYSDEKDNGSSKSEGKNDAKI
ncbi:vacuole effluxer Atg22 like-domain-containing protein [Lactarius sanguifluus]|nr:vacuole effluxer Atg22 like-domain-containing protein [Lactarius sanguifluus]